MKPESRILNKEIWTDVSGYEGVYMVSNYGRVKSHSRYVPTRGRNGKWRERLIKGIILRPCLGRGGYKLVDLKSGKKPRNMAKIHRLVGIEFIPNPENKPEINHIDGDPGNNNVWNLEWCTHQENMRHATDNGMIKFKAPLGEKSSFSILKEFQVRRIRERLAVGELPSRIAQDYPIGVCCIKQIRSGATWSHLV